ncbi:MAG: M1 family metallopeptidase [Chloroflexota bacterium]
MMSLRYGLLIGCVALALGFAPQSRASTAAHLTEDASDSQACLPLEGGRPATAHIVVADVDYGGRTVSVEQRIRYANPTGVPLARLLLNVEANRWPGVVRLDSVRADGLTDYTLSGKQLNLTFDTPLQPHCVQVISLSYQLNVPQIGVQIHSSKGYLGYTNRQLNLGHWLATVAPYIDGEWISRQPSITGEQNVEDAADWQVTLHVMNAPDTIQVAAPGIMQTINPSGWRFTLLGAREFSASMSDQFRVETMQTADGVTVEAYTFNQPGLEAAAAHSLQTAADSLALFSGLFGPYPYERLVVVQGDFPDGMEFSGLIFVGDSWYTRYDGIPAGYLTLITAHEVAHQWWYLQVGNDPALAPWLDEALTTYTEYLFIARRYPELADWWWSYRVDAYNPQGFVDGSVYDFASVRAYIDAVYLRGARFMRDLHADLGDGAFYRLLAVYLETQRGQIAGPEDFWSLLTPQQIAATEDTRARYFRQPEAGIISTGP